MKYTRRILLAGAALALPISLLGGTYAAAPVEPKTKSVDVYVLYSSKEKGDKDDIIEALGDDLEIKSYGTDKLKLSDYSGKQKAIAKIDAAELVILLGDGSSKILKDAKFKSPVIILRSAGRKAFSQDWNLNIVEEGTDVKDLPHSKDHVSVGSVKELEGLEDVLDAEAVTVTDPKKNFLSVAAALIKLKLDD